MAVGPGASNTDLTNPNVNMDSKTPGSPMWWFARLAQRLVDRQATFDVRENYVTGNHPIPNGDRRFAKALREIQNKAKTNYIYLVTQAVTQKMRVKDFAFGPEGEIDDDAKRIWEYNDMNFQSPILINDAATFGFAYGIVYPPDEDDGEPVIVYRSPRVCEIERDPNRPTRVAAALEFWVDYEEDRAFAIVYLPDNIYYFNSEGITSQDLLRDIGSAGIIGSINRFVLDHVESNNLGVVPVERLDWMPEAGEAGQSEGEVGFSIQDRINLEILDRLVIARNQAYRQRWVSGGPEVRKGQKAPWDPGSDMVWISTNPETKFGDFSEADIKQLLEATRDSVGDLAAITQTPATALTNRMINVAEKTVEQVLRGHHDKVRLRQDSAGLFFERLIKIAFAYKNDRQKSADPYANTVWFPVETHSIAEVADAFQKEVASGVPLKLAMEKTGKYTAQEIEWAIEEAERLKQEEIEREQQTMDKQLEAQKEAAKTSAEAKSKPQPSATSKPKTS